MRPLNIIFLGTPEFAVASLDALHHSTHRIVAVVTAPDKPAGRGMKLSVTAVKQYALEHDLPLLQPPKLKDPRFLGELEAFDADIQVVVAFRMLPEVVWNMPPMGTVNLHASLLPQYRGAAPINWAIINGERETGLTTFRLQHEIDTGNLLLQERMVIGSDETAGELHDRMKLTGAALLVRTMDGLADGSLQEKSQDDLLAGNAQTLRHAPKIFTETCKIDWNRSCHDIFNLIRGLSPYPTAFTYLHKKMLKVFRARFEVVEHGKEPGRFETDGKNFLKVTAIDGFVYLNELQLEGKKRLKVEDFLRGYRFDQE